MRTFEHSVYAVVSLHLVFGLESPDVRAQSRLEHLLEKLPLFFVANEGQWDPQVAFRSGGAGCSVVLTRTGARLATGGPERSAHIEMKFVGGRSDPEITGARELPGTVNDFSGGDPSRWHTGIKTLAEVHYREIYPGVDLIFRGNPGRLEYDISLAAGADPESVILEFDGADRLTLDATGDLILDTSAGRITHAPPHAYQDTRGRRQRVASGYRILGERRVGFHLGGYDRRKPLIIDPVVTFSTFLGIRASSPVYRHDVATDADGKVYLVGETETLPLPTGGTQQPAPDPGGLNRNKAYVLKIDPERAELVYATYLDGDLIDAAEGIAADAQGNAYVTGRTSSTNFPVTPGAYDTTRTNRTSAFVSKISPTGDVLIYSTLIGGEDDQSADDIARAIALDSGGRAWVTGQTSSSNFPTTADFFQPARGAFGEAFVCQLNADGTDLLFSAYLGGSRSDTGLEIAVDDDDLVYVAGITESSDFPTVNGYQATYGGGAEDGFVLKFDPAGAVTYSSFLGGDHRDKALGLDVDADGNAYITGETPSADFPTFSALEPVFTPAFGTSTAAFVTKLDPTGRAIYSTYLTPGRVDTGLDIVAGADGNAYVRGSTQIDAAEPFPAVDPALECGRTNASFLVELDPAGTEVLFATCFGSSGDAFVARAASGDLYVTGEEQFSGAFPVIDPIQEGLAGVYVSRLAPDTDPPTLELDSPRFVTLTDERPIKYLQLSAPPGEPVVITVTDPGASGANVLLLRWGSLPEVFEYDLSAEERGRASQRLVVPFFRREVAFLALKAHSISGAANQLTVEARVAEPTLEKISTTATGRGANGLLSAGVTGGGFTADTVFTLNGEGRELSTGERVVVSSQRAELVFPLGGAAPGVYDLTARNGGGSEDTLEAAVEVTDTDTGPILRVQVVGPRVYRLGRLARMSLKYANIGDREMTAPLFRVVSGSQSELRLETDEEFAGSSLQVLGVDPGGVAGRLAPGTEGEIPILVRTPQNGETLLEVFVLTPNRDDYISWDQRGPPPGLDEAAWTSLWPSLSVVLGATWREYGESLARLATRLGRRGVDASAVRRLVHFAAREALDRPTAAIAGRVRDASGAPLAGEIVVALQDGLARASSTTGPRGRFTLDWLENGAAYDLVLVDRDVGSVSATLPESGDILGLSLLASVSSNDYAPDCLNCDERGLPVGPLVPPDSVMTKVAEWTSDVISSVDPNEKEGPSGPDDDGLVAIGQELHYTIYFENLPSATAAAQEVFVVDQLAPEYDWSSFRLKEVGVADVISSLDIEAGGAIPSVTDAYGARARLHGLGVGGRWTADVRCVFDPGTGRIEWTFGTLDPDTGLPPEDPEAGFLPPDDATGRGEGHVSFTVLTGPDEEPGSELLNRGVIAFDNLASLETNLHRSRVRLPELFEAPTFPLPGDGINRQIECDTALTWPPQLGAHSYDIYLWTGDTRPADPIASGLTSPGYPLPADILKGTEYRWQVVARTDGAPSEGPTWRFKTVDEPPDPPESPESLLPPAGATGVPAEPTLDWAPAARASAYDVFLWRHATPRPEEPAVRGIVATEFPVEAPLESGVEYDWQIVAVNRSGRTEGSTRSFTTGGGPDGAATYVRGDANTDRQIDVSDGIFVLLFLFGGEEIALDCEKSGDFNDDGRLDTSDPLALFALLFSGNPRVLAEPFGRCGVDPTPDGLSCASYAACE